MNKKRVALILPVVVLVFASIWFVLKRFGASTITSARLVGDQFFYLEAASASKHGLLKVRRASEQAGRELLDPNSLAPAGKTASILDIEPSWDGKYVAIGLTPDGSKDRVIRVVRVSDGALLNDVIARTVDGDASWADDNASFYYRAFQVLPAGAPPAARYENMRAYVHRLGEDATLDKAVFGPDVTPELHLPKAGFVNAFPLPGTTLELAVQSSAPAELDSFWMQDLAAKGSHWRQIVDHKDDVLFEFASRGSMFYYVTTAGAPNGRVMAFDTATEDISQAREVLPQSDFMLSDREVCGVAGAKDALYVYGKRKGTPVVVRIPYDNPAARQEVALPNGGVLSDVGADFRVPGLVFTLSRWMRPSEFYVYDPGRKVAVQVPLR